MFHLPQVFVPRVERERRKILEFVTAREIDRALAQAYELRQRFPRQKFRRMRVHGAWGSVLQHKSGVVEASLCTPNVITDVLLDALLDALFNSATTQAGFFFMAIGTGAVPAVGTDTALGAEIDRQATDFTAGGTGTATVRPTAGKFTGNTATVTERGLFDQGAIGGNMANRKVESGVPVVPADIFAPFCVLTATG